MDEGSRLYERPRAGGRLLKAWEEDRQTVMSEEEWLALSDDRRQEILLMYERLRKKRTPS